MSHVVDVVKCFVVFYNLLNLYNQQTLEIKSCPNMEFIPLQEIR